VMTQYEREHKNFVFLGAAPIDFDARPGGEGAECVWKKLCELDLARELRQGKTDLAAILNADPHHRDGSHWMTLYIDLKDGYILYFDSTGDAMPRQVRRLIDRLTSQARKLGIEMRVLISRARHQRQNTECGIYGLFAVSELLEGTRTPESLMRGRISDAEMHRFRTRFFNIPERKKKGKGA
jgi:hypothetical protein